MCIRDSVHCENDAVLCRPDAAKQRVVLAIVPQQMHAVEPRILVRELFHYLGAAVAAAVVYQYRLVLLGERGQRHAEPVQKNRQTLL